MADKLSWSELRRALANRAGVSEKEANSFLNALSGQLVEALKSDKQVKINGLGMFKLQAVAPRKSVDVTTGEEITIEGYNKIVFAPEAGQCLATIGSTCVPIPGAMGVSDYLMIEGYIQMMPRDFAFQVQMLSRSVSFYSCVIVSGVTLVIGVLLLGRRGKK